MERVFSIQEADTGPHQHLIDQRKDSTTSLSRIVANRKLGCCQKHKLKFISLIAIVSAIIVALSGFGIYETINSKKECLEDFCTEKLSIINRSVLFGWILIGFERVAFRISKGHFGEEFSAR